MSNPTPTYTSIALPTRSPTKSSQLCRRPAFATPFFPVPLPLPTASPSTSKKDNRLTKRQSTSNPSSPRTVLLSPNPSNVSLVEVRLPSAENGTGMVQPSTSLDGPSTSTSTVPTTTTVPNESGTAPTTDDTLFDHFNRRQTPFVNECREVVTKSITRRSIDMITKDWQSRSHRFDHKRADEDLISNKTLADRMVVVAKTKIWVDQFVVNLLLTSLLEGSTIHEDVVHVLTSQIMTAVKENVNEWLDSQTARDILVRSIVMTGKPTFGQQSTDTMSHHEAAPNVVESIEMARAALRLSTQPVGDAERVNHAAHLVEVAELMTSLMENTFVKNELPVFTINVLCDLRQRLNDASEGYTV